MTPWKLARIDEHHWRGAVGSDWFQGRGLFGGLLAAASLEAMGALIGDPAREPRSLTIHFMNPGPDQELRLEAEVVRAGSRVSHAVARVSAEGRPVTMASASFGRDRTATVRYDDARMPPAPAFEDCPRFKPAPGVPNFVRHFDMRLAYGERPFSSGKQPEIGGWVRLAEPAPIDAPVAAMLLDVPPPAYAVLLAKPEPMASVEYTVRFFQRLPRADLAPEAPLFIHLRSRWADRGYAEELRELYTASGLLLAECHQLFAIL
ncbi:MAG: thioesterase family protein [Myxococcota bacterium]